jgi:hypothetical protein
MTPAKLSEQKKQGTPLPLPCHSKAEEYFFATVCA